MKSASNNTYISKRMISAYAEERSKRAQQKEAKKQAPLLPVKEFAEAEEDVKEETKEEPMSMQPLPKSLDAQPSKKESAAKSVPQPQPKVGMMKSALNKISGALPSFGSKKDKAMAANSSSDEEMDEEVYMQRNLSACAMDADDLEGDLNLSDCEDNNAMQSRGYIKAQKKQERKKKGMKKAQKFHMEVDTNIFEVEFACLKNEAALATGDPEVCPHCKAIFNSQSKIIVENGNQIWVCEFCNHRNEVMLDEGEIPKTNTTNYLVEASAQVEEQKMGGQEISVIFCLDVSGSMCVTQEVDGKFKLRNDKRQQLAQSLAHFGDNSDQFINQAQKNKTYISRLQCVQSAVDSQIDQMGKGAPNRKVGIVTFNGEVTVLGDGHADPQMIAGDKLMDYDYLEKNGGEQAEKLMCKPIKDAQKMLQDKLMSIEETGPTALGPAVLTSVALAAKGAPGSTVVICTDGLANVGLGAFDEAKTEEKLAEVETFYERVGQLAQSHGVTINLVSIEGDDCNIESLSKICELTGGNVDRVDPVNLTKNFTNVLSKPVIATQVVTKVKLHKGLRFRNEIETNLAENQTLLVKESGNVTEDDVFTFEYTIKTIEELLSMEDIDLTQMKSFPFQAQIAYTSLKGDKMVRVITQTLAVCEEREEVEKNADQDIVQKNVIQQASKIARGGDVAQAQAVTKAWKRHMKNNITSESQFKAYGDFSSKFGEVYQQLDEVRHEQEEMDYAYECSAPQQMMADNMMLGGGVSFGAPAQKSAMKSKAKQSDKLSSMLYKGSRASKK